MSESLEKEHVKKQREKRDWLTQRKPRARRKGINIETWPELKTIETVRQEGWFFKDGTGAELVKGQKCLTCIRHTLV